MIRILAVLFLALVLPFGLVTSPASAAPEGEVLIKTIRNEPTGGRCGNYTVQATNASDTAVKEVRLLMYVWTGGEVGDTVPFRGKKARSWVKWPMYLKPGKTIQGDIDLCTTVSLLPNAVDFASFVPERVRWKWVR